MDKKMVVSIDGNKYVSCDGDSHPLPIEEQRATIGGRGSIDVHFRDKDDESTRYIPGKKKLHASLSEPFDVVKGQWVGYEGFDWRVTEVMSPYEFTAELIDNREA